MKYSAIIFAGLLVSLTVGCKESEDPSYEPQRGSNRSSRPKTEKAPVTEPAVIETPSTAKSNPSQPVTEFQAPSGPRVKYIVDGKPVYEGEAPIAGIDDKKSVPSNRKKESASSKVTEPVVEYPAASGPRVKYIIDGKPVYEGDPPVAGIDEKKFGNSSKKNSGSLSPVEIIGDPAPAVPSAAAGEYQAPSGPRIKYILDGKPVYEGDAPAATQRETFVSSPDAIGSQATGRPSASLIEDDLTADKPGSPAAAEKNPVLLDEYVAGEHLSTRASKCYKLLAELKTNVETISRCLDNRGKENARLIHTADEASNNITQIADIWPGNSDFIERCVIDKRYALLFNDELSRTPWKWAQVRWSFDAFLKDVRGFRQEVKALADAEPKQVPRRLKDGSYARLKDGTTIWEDAPESIADQLAAKQEAKRKADREALAKMRKGEEIRSDSEKNRLDTDLRNAR